MVDFYSEGTLRIFDPYNANERQLVHSIAQEDIERQSPIIHWFKINHTQSILNMDEVDKIYGENDNSIYHVKPVQIFAIVEKSPIITELQRMGFAQIEEINFICNIPQTLKLLGREPKEGDLFRISSFGYNENEKNIHRFYKVSTVYPSDMILGHYTNFIVNAEQTNLNDAPQEIIDLMVNE